MRRDDDPQAHEFGRRIYRKYAANSFDLASRQSDSADQSRLLSMAEAWLDLADRVAKRNKRT
jgi:hypothetical protein